MKRLLSALALAGLLPVSLGAQVFEPSVNVAVDARVDYMHEWLATHTDDNASGFKGKYLNLMVNGDINSHFSYSWRQRLNKSIGAGSTFFDATDWITLTYRPDIHWEVSAGKQVVAIGGYEYDRAPINCFSCSEFWNNIPCYQLGLSGAYTLKGGKDKFMVQICQSPFARLSGNNNTYAYNLMWMGNHGIYSSLWSVNMVEYQKNRYISYISLGNRFEYQNVSLELDLMNRAKSHQTFFFKDCSVMAELGWTFHPKWHIFAKTTYDVNRSGTDGDYCVYDGSELWQWGGGLEFHPLKNGKHDIRLHAVYFHTHGTNTNPAGTMRNDADILNVGLTWRFDIVKWRKS